MHIRKAILRGWRQEFARHLRALGVRANARACRAGMRREVERWRQRRIYGRFSGPPRPSGNGWRPKPRTIQQVRRMWK